MSPVESTWVIEQGGDSCGKGPGGKSLARISSRPSYSYGLFGVRSLDFFFTWFVQSGQNTVCWSY